MSDMEGEVAPELEVDDADLLEQATPVPADDDDQYPFGPEATEEPDLVDEDEEPEET